MGCGGSQEAAAPPPEGPKPAVNADGQIVIPRKSSRANIADGLVNFNSLTRDDDTREKLMAVSASSFGLGAFGAGVLRGERG